MGRIDWDELLEEILVFVRNNATDTQSGRVTNVTEEFNGDDSTVAFTLAQATAKNVKTVTVGGASKTFGTDYTVNYQPGASATIVTFTTAPAAGSDNVDINYDYGKSWIRPDWPREELSLNSYPRIAVDFVNVVTTPGGLNVPSDFNDVMFAVTIFAKNESGIRSLIKELRDAFAGAKKSFYYATKTQGSYVQPAGISAIIRTEDRKAQVLQCTLTFRIPHLYESNS